MGAIEDLLAKVKPATASVRVCLRGDLLGELDLINDDLTQYDGWEQTGMGADPRTDLQARKTVLESEMRDDSAVFTFETIGDKPWSDLLAAHPAREGQGEVENFNPDTFPVALLAASSVEPKMTAEQVGVLFDSFTLSQRNGLFGAAYSANVRGVDIPFSRPAFDATVAFAKK